MIKQELHRKQSWHIPPPVAATAPFAMPAEAPLYRKNEKRAVGETYQIEEIPQILLRNILLAVLLFYNIGSCAQEAVHTIYKKGQAVLSVQSGEAGCRFTLSSGKNKNDCKSGNSAAIAESDAPGLFRLLSGLRDFVRYKEDRPMTVRLNDSIQAEKRGFQTGYIRILVDGTPDNTAISHKELEEMFRKFTAWCNKNEIDYY